MSLLIGGERLRQLVRDGVIENGVEDSVEGIKYDFHFGGRFLKAKHRKALSVDNFGPGNVEDTQVEPGETVFVLTQEVLRLPKDIKVELSHKRKLAHNGVIALGGFCVDPLYEGPLVIGIHNFSSRPFPLLKGKKLIAGQFYRLAPEECEQLPKPQSISDFPDELADIVARLSGVSNVALAQRVEQIDAVVKSLRVDFKQQKKWYDSFKDLLDEVRNLLKQEIDERQKGQAEITKLLKEHEKNLKELNLVTERHKVYVKVAVWFTVVVLGLLITYTFGPWLSSFVGRVPPGG